MTGLGQQSLDLLLYPAEAQSTINPHCIYHSLWIKINTSLEKYGICPFIHPLTHSQASTEYLLWNGNHSNSNQEHKDIKGHNLMSIFNYNGGLIALTVI